MSSLEHPPRAAGDPLGWLRERLPTLAFSMFFSAVELRASASMTCSSASGLADMSIEPWTRFHGRVVQQVSVVSGRNK